MTVLVIKELNICFCFLSFHVVTKYKVAECVGVCDIDRESENSVVSVGADVNMSCVVSVISQKVFRDHFSFSIPPSGLNCSKASVFCDLLLIKVASGRPTGAVGIVRNGRLSPGDSVAQLLPPAVSVP